MGELKEDMGMVGEESRKAKEWLFKRKTRREFLQVPIKVAKLAPVALLFGAPVLCRLIDWLSRSGIMSVENPIAARGVSQQKKEAKVSWTTLLGEHNAQTLWESIDFFSGNLNPKTQRLTDFESIKGTQLERALFGFRDFMERIRTPDGRQELRTEIKSLERQMDVGGYKSFIDNLEKYINSQSGRSVDELLKDYFTHVPNPSNPDENYGLGYPEKDWKFMLDVEKAINEKDRKGLSELMKDYKTIESSPQG